LSLHYTFNPKRSKENLSDSYSALLQLTRPLTDYRIIVAITRGDIGGINILKDALEFSKHAGINQILLALGPTTPLALRPPPGTRVLWATFTDASQESIGPKLTVVHPTHLTDLSLNLEKLSKTRSGHVPVLIGDFLDNVLAVSSAPPGLYAFLCKLFTRIRTNNQTAFLLTNADMHDPRKTAILRRFADVVIEYEAHQDGTNHRLQAKILDHDNNTYSCWDSDENASPEYEQSSPIEESFARSGRQNNLITKDPLTIIR